MIEYIAIGAIVFVAAAFVGWRAYQTARASKGKCNTGCGKCGDPAETKARPAKGGM